MLRLKSGGDSAAIRNSIRSNPIRLFCDRIPQDGRLDDTSILIVSEDPADELGSKGDFQSELDMPFGVGTRSQYLAVVPRALGVLISRPSVLASRVQ